VFESREQVQTALRKQEIDIGFCGLPVSDFSVAGFDFLPPHLDSGLSFVVKDLTSGSVVDYTTVLNELLGPFRDPQAIVALLILFVFAIFFSHIFYAMELGGDEVFHDDYGPGIVDAFWCVHMHIFDGTFAGARVLVKISRLSRAHTAQN